MFVIVVSVSLTYKSCSTSSQQPKIERSNDTHQENNNVIDSVNHSIDIENGNEI